MHAFEYELGISWYTAVSTKTIKYFVRVFCIKSKSTNSKITILQAALHIPVLLPSWVFSASCSTRVLRLMWKTRPKNELVDYARTFCYTKLSHFSFTVPKKEFHLLFKKINSSLLCSYIINSNNLINPHALM